MENTIFYVLVMHAMCHNVYVCCGLTSNKAPSAAFGFKYFSLTFVRVINSEIVVSSSNRPVKSSDS